MTTSRHSAVRCQQRGIPALVVDLLLQFGRCDRAVGGAQMFSFDKNSRKKLRSYAGPLARLLDDHFDVYAVVSDDSTVITVAHRLERIQRERQPLTPRHAKKHRATQ